MAERVSILDQTDLFFPHLHLTGAQWDQAPRNSFESRLDALAEHGCTGMGMGRDELAKLLTERSPAELKALLDDHGVRIGELELLFGWDAGEELHEQAKALEDDLFSLAAQSGAGRFKASAYYPPGVELPPTEYLAERFAALCDRAAERGLEVALESIAVNPGFTYAVAADVVAAADRPNGGLLIDFWHVFRDPTGLAAVRGLEGKHVIGVELSDATAKPAEDIRDECVNHRLLPGEGELDLTGLVRLLDEKGAEVTLSVEVLSAELRTLSASENVARTLAAVRKFRTSAR